MRLGGIDGLLHIVGDLHRHRAADDEVLQRHAVRALGEAFFEYRDVLLQTAGHQMHAEPAVRDFRGQADVALGGRAEHDRNIRIAVQDTFQRLTQAARSGRVLRIGQRDFPALMRNGTLALQDLLDDGHVIAHAIGRLAPRLAMPAFDDLRAGHADAQHHASLAGHGIDGLRAHGQVGRGARGQRRDAGAQADALGQRADEGQRRDGVGTVGLGGPHRVESELFGTQNALDRQFHLGVGIVEAQGYFHRVLLLLSWVGAAARPPVLPPTSVAGRLGLEWAPAFRN